MDIHSESKVQKRLLPMKQSFLYILTIISVYNSPTWYYAYRQT